MDCFAVMSALADDQETFVHQKVVTIDTNGLQKVLWAPQKRTGWAKFFRAFLAALITVTAAYFSWSCNVGMSTGWRVTNAVFAGIFGTVYIAYLILVRWDQCKARL
jgi:hypothetical protein